MIMIICSMIFEPPKVILKMPIITQKYVELSCSQTKEGFLIPLSFNLVLLVSCAIHGFLIRKLPENFNESWYIFVSVLTTLFMWIVFLPTYFSTFYAYHQVALLGLCLILNGFITLMTLYTPKLYAIYFVDEDKLRIQKTNITNMSGPSVNRGQVAPVTHF